MKALSHLDRIQRLLAGPRGLEQSAAIRSKDRDHAAGHYRPSILMSSHSFTKTVFQKWEQSSDVLRLEEIKPEHD